MLKDILVIGSIHLDIIGSYFLSKNNKDSVDKEGAFDISVGGAAYNIAYNLLRNKKRASIFSIIKEGSLGGDDAVK